MKLVDAPHAQGSLNRAVDIKVVQLVEIKLELLHVLHAGKKCKQHLKLAINAYQIKKLATTAIGKGVGTIRMVM